MFQKGKTTNKLTALLLTLVMLLSLVPGMGLTAYATQEETLLTTITPTGKTTYSETTSGVVTVSHNNDSYNGNGGWQWYSTQGTLTISGCEGYTITKVIFRQKPNRNFTDSSEPFELHFNKMDETNHYASQENYQINGVTSIEVYGYANKPAAPAAVTFTKVTDASQITAENIGTCAAEDAKSWAIANWDDVTDSYAAVIAFYSNTGELNVVWFYCGLSEEEFHNDFDNYINTTTSISDIQQGFDTSASVFICTPAAPGAYADLENTTTVITFDNKQWYLIEDNSTSATEGTVTLLSKECVAASQYNSSGSYVEYASSTVKTAVENYYTSSISSNVKTAIVDNKMFLLTTDQARAINTANADVLKCTKYSEAQYNCWWLCSQVSRDGFAAFVSGSNGSVDDNYGGLVTYTLGVRPALKLDLSKVTFDSESKTFSIPTLYPLWVGGTQVTSANTSNIDGNNKASYDAETNTLTLNGYTNSGTARADIQSGVNNAAIYYNDNMSSPNPLTIQLAEGTTNSLTMTGDRVYGIYVFGSALTITGNGTLNVQSDDMAINDAWGVAITGGTVNAASSTYYGIGSVTIGADISSVTITGKLGAIYGGSNEEQELINAVAGTGWTDVAGTTGKAAIAISTAGQNVSSYKKVYFTPHTHDFNYSVNGATITATCTDGCPAGYDNANKPTLTIVAPERNVYGGTGSAAATLDGLDAFNAATGLNVDADSIVYWKAKIIEGVYKTDGNEPLAGAPTNAGNYLAKITVSNCIASVGYTIAKADPTYTVPTGLTATYGDTLADVTLPTGWSWANDTQSVGAVGTNTFKATFTPEDTDNYNVLENLDVTVTVTHIPGDIDGDGEVNNKDLTRLFQYLSDWDVEVNEAALDVNGDGSVNNKDLTRLFQYLSDWDVEIY